MVLARPRSFHKPIKFNMTKRVHSLHKPIKLNMTWCARACGQEVASPEPVLTLMRGRKRPYASNRIADECSSEDMGEAQGTSMEVLEQQPLLQCPDSVCTPAPRQGQRHICSLEHPSADGALMDPVQDALEDESHLSLNATRAVKQIAATQAASWRRAAAR